MADARVASRSGLSQRAAAGILAVGLLLCGVLVGLIARPDNALYAQITAIMDERDRLWSLGPDEGGRRERDATDAVCPLVSEAALDEIYSEEGFWFFVEIRRENIENGQGVFPDNSKKWSVVRRRSSLFYNDMLVVVLSETGCKSWYQRI